MNFTIKEAPGIGVEMANVKKIVDLKDREEVTMEVEVVKIFAPREFIRKDGRPGKVRNIMVKDDTGDCRLALWDDDTDLIERLGITVGSRLRCQDCYVKQTDYGTDVGKGKKGSIALI
ncbi:MAG: hypothetical protein HPY73_00030 [Methanomassiliicoccales archaeon]|nr:MAG: hypothetical protein HPY73_00030 [Methanomassiliicoccales archaeon]